jgi:hypothetical protein
MHFTPTPMLRKSSGPLRGRPGGQLIGHRVEFVTDLLDAVHEASGVGLDEPSQDAGQKSMP